MVGEFPSWSENNIVDPDRPRVTKTQRPPMTWPPSYQWRDKGFKVSYSEAGTSWMWRIERIPEPLPHDDSSHYYLRPSAKASYSPSDFGNNYGSITEEELAVLVEARQDILASIAADPTTIKKMEIPETRGVNEKTDTSS